MKNRHCALGLLLASLSFASTAPRLLVAQQSATSTSLDRTGFRELFDGRSLAGWRGAEGLWSVEDGVLVGSTDGKTIRANSFLVWQGDDLANFELRAVIRVLGKNNSGIQYRSRIVNAENFRVHGYQADLHPKPSYHGMLYEEGGRGIVAQSGQSVTLEQGGGRKVTGSPRTESIHRIDDWHELRVIARGRTLEHYIDGRLCVRIIDDSKKAKLTGKIALQLHRGPSMRVECRSLRLRRLPGGSTEGANAETPKKGAAAKATKRVIRGDGPRWIWLGDATDDDVVQFRRRFKLGRARKAILFLSCDNGAEVKLDGKLIGESSEWWEPKRIEIGRMKKGDHLLEVKARNTGGPAGLVAKLQLGDRRVVRTDAQWEARRPGEEKWRKANELALLGAGPWGKGVKRAFRGVPLAPYVETSRPAEELEIHAGFGGERLLELPSEYGSWVAITAADDGVFYASDQRRGLYRIEVERLENGSSRSKVSAEPVDLDGAQGLCLVDGVLYASVNGKNSGFWRVTDSDKDGRFDKAERLLQFFGAGEHGPHSIVRTPDGRELYVVCGNHTALPERSHRRAMRPVGAFAEDHIPQVLFDPRGHAKSIRAPGGYVLRVDLDCKRPRLHSTGYRNVFDIAVDGDGEVFAYDADMEWDFGLPWYRPTRILHAVPGADFGWRTGSSKWSTHCEDSLPAVHDIGPGSPTALLLGRQHFGASAAFPPEWQDKLYALDWTFGTIWALDLKAKGASYEATRKPFVTGKPLPLTDACIGSDGAMYFLTGGRSTGTRMYRVAYDGALDASAGAASARRTPRVRELVALRHKLESFQGMLSEDAAKEAQELALANLDHEDRFVRHAARLALEATPVVHDGSEMPAIDAQKRPLAAAVLLLVRARFLDTRKARTSLFSEIAAFPVKSATRDTLLCVLRACEIAIANYGAPKPSVRRAVIASLDPLFPKGDTRVDAELARVLCALDAPSAVAKCLARMDARDRFPAQDWQDLLSRNDSYGRPIRRMLADPPPTLALHYVNCLRLARSGWTAARYQRVFSFLKRARRFPAGNSYKGYIDAMRDALLKKMNAASKRQVASILGSWDNKGSQERFTQPQGPGRKWTVDDAMKSVDEGALASRSYLKGRNLYHSIGCASCHRFDGEGGGVGPDLTTVADKYSLRETLESLIEPDTVIADQFVAQRVELKNGRTILGQVASTAKAAAGKSLTLWPASAESEAMILDRSEIRSIVPAKTSPMPKGLLDKLNADELQDLVAFLRAASESKIRPADAETPTGTKNSGEAKSERKR